ncbi:uncharacterized protein LOC142504931 [Primulina tabacum]|uniref:uncharacterized protein LOC142504931 n=1 Tax=Primulina tabacum TaxID=48773 RepID=UPI003F5AB009
MKPGETLAEFDERFNGIIIELTSLGKDYSNREIALKVMRALPREWDVKTIAMRESKDLNKLELHDLFADLKAYEFELGIQTEEDPSTSQQTKALPATITNKPHYNKDHTDDGQACFNCGKKGHIIAECNRPKKDEKNSSDRRRLKDNKRFIKKKNQRVLVAEEDKGQWADSESEKSISKESSSESEDEKVECLMAKEDQESTDEVVFDFNSDEFTRDDLVTALHDMVNEFKRLSQQFNEATTEKQNLGNKLSFSSCSQQKEVNGLKVKLSLLTAENDDLRRLFHATLKENKRLINTINIWNKSSVSLNEMHEMQKPAGDKTGIGYSINECSTSGVSKKRNLEKSIWFLDSGCSRHMTGNKDLLSEVVNYKGPTITFGDNFKGKAVGKENKRLIDTINIWNKSSVSLNKMHEMQKPAGDKIGIGYSINECSTFGVSKKRNLEKSIWFLDSGCSRHMTGNKDLLSEVVNYKGPTITFGDNSKGKAVGKGKIIHDKIIIRDGLRTVICEDCSMLL